MRSFQMSTEPNKTLRDWWWMIFPIGIVGIKTSNESLLAGLVLMVTAGILTYVTRTGKGRFYGL